MQRNNPLVLIIDDDWTSLEISTYFLKRAGCRIICSDTGIDGLAHARISRPDLILLDYMMPDMDGRKTCQMLQSNPETSSIPVIFHSAAAGDSYIREQAFEAGAMDILGKQCSVTDLQKIVMKYITISQLSSNQKEGDEILKTANAALQKSMEIINDDTHFKSRTLRSR